jgi:hypothetical protein
LPWLRCNDPVFYCGKEMAEARVESKVAPAGDRPAQKETPREGGASVVGTCPTTRKGGPTDTVTRGRVAAL